MASISDALDDRASPASPCLERALRGKDADVHNSTMQMGAINKPPGRSLDSTQPWQRLTFYRLDL